MLPGYYPYGSKNVIEQYIYIRGVFSSILIRLKHIYVNVIALFLIQYKYYVYITFILCFKYVHVHYKYTIIYNAIPKKKVIFLIN